ncbi:M15 family metallopeptidase [soil metagenome]
MGEPTPTTVAPTTVTTEVTAPTTTTTMTTIPTTTTTTLPAGVTHPPGWLGTRVLPLGDAGNPQVLPTPPELADRRFTTPEWLDPPPTEGFHHTIDPVPADVAARSTWQPECPVGLEDLAYVTVSFWGFDGGHHTGELIVHTEVAEDIVEVFEAIWASRFPIEEMRITSLEELDALPTGDGNNTDAFVCRAVTGGTGWSQHALGLAVDINPFHNPYRRGSVVIPELATAYLDRDRALPGMIVEGDAVTSAFDAIGWGWGGRWATLDDWQHFSRNNR